MLATSNKKISPIIGIETDKCVNCHACISACPVKYCNDGSGDHIDLNHDMCIGCGSCLDACTHDARHVFDDFDNFLEDIHAGEKIVGIVAPSIASNFPHHYLNFNGWLKSLGVEGVFDVSFGAELTVKSYIELQKTHHSTVIAQPCPAIVSYIEIFQPELIKYLAPVDSPMGHVVKMIREFYPHFNDHKIAAFSPCVAKKREFDETGLVDYNITFVSLVRHIRENNINLCNFPETDFDSPPPERGVLFSSPGGLTSTANRESPGIDKFIRKVEGPGNVYPYLNHLKEMIDINRAPLLVDCLNCPLGCNGGTGTDLRESSPDEIEYFVKERDRTMREFYGKQKKAGKAPRIGDFIEKYWKPDFYIRKYINRSCNNIVRIPSEEEVSRIYHTMHKCDESDILNCSSCGYNSCEGMAVAIHNGLNRPENCFQYREAAFEEAEAARQEAIKAKMLDKAKSEFLAMMSHEIRTPMNGVIGMTSLLDGTELTDEQREYVETIRVSGDALLTIINDILDFSKIEAGKLELENTPFELKRCVEEALDVFAKRAAEKSVELICHVEDDVPAFINGDITRLRQIIVNLVNNALKFTKAGEVYVHVDISEKMHENYILRFAVRDTGIGIPKEKLKYLFDAFSQVDSFTTRVYGGTGLGLAISKRLAEGMGGRIWVESEPGNGSSFYFTFSASQAEGEVSYAYLEYDIPELSGLKVLIVDDNETNRRVLTRQCERWGISSVAVPLAEKALSLLKAGEKFDILLSDFHMPEMDGRELALEVRRRFSKKELPIIILSSVDDKMEKDICDAYLTKPVKQSKLFDTLLEVLSSAGIISKKEKTNQGSDDETSASISTISHKGPLRILVAEDNLINQKLTLRILEKLGCVSDVVNNGKEALIAVQKKDYDLVFMDCQMPVMDGYDATHEIRSLRNHPSEKERKCSKIPIIAMTANAMIGDKEKCLEAGMDDYISKPIRKDDVGKIIETYRAMDGKTVR